VEAFIDSNIILKYLEGDPRAKKILDIVDVGFINPIVVSEVLYGYIRLMTGFKSYDLKKKFPSLTLELKPIYESLSDFILLPLVFELRELQAMMERFKLLPNDALIALTCRHYRVEKIATFDNDFKRVDFLTVLS